MTRTRITIIILGSLMLFSMVSYMQMRRQISQECAVKVLDSGFDIEEFNTAHEACMRIKGY